MFEPENLANASPATVSRAGIIYVSDTELGWEPVVKSWLQKRENAESTLMTPLFDKYVNRMLDFIRLNLHPVMYNEQVRRCRQSGEGAAAGWARGRGSIRLLRPPKRS